MTGFDFSKLAIGIYYYCLPYAKDFRNWQRKNELNAQ